MNHRKIIVILSALLAVFAIIVGSKSALGGPLEHSASVDAPSSGESSVVPAPNAPEADNTDVAEPEKDPVPEPEPIPEPEPEPKPVEPPVFDPDAEYDPSFFDNALFIGDSRTVGIRNNANLGEAEVFATTGLNVFRVLNETVTTRSGETKLVPLLESKSFDKIYIMLGINEIGYNIEAIKKKYTDLVETVLEKQPDAQIYMCANLHITNERSSTDDIYNNERLNSINEYMKSFADGAKVKYLDVNVLFDDENNALGKEYAADAFHLYAQYYVMWARWLAAMSI